MKSAVTSLGCMLLAVVTFIIITTISSVGIRSDELNTAVDVAMAATQKSVYERRDAIYDDETYMAAFSNNLLAQIDSLSDIDIIFYTANFEKGILDVEVVSKFDFITDRDSGKKHQYKVRRTSIIDISHPLKFIVSVKDASGVNVAKDAQIVIKNSSGQIVAQGVSNENGLFETNHLVYGDYSYVVTYQGKSVTGNIKYEKESLPFKVEVSII